MHLNALQSELEHIYEVAIPERVEDFLITDGALAARLDADDGARDIPEKLIVREDEHGVDLALYVEGAVLDRLAADDPIACLHDGNIADTLTALEGVSHFLYLVWNATFDRSVTQLELELQAEVDKYVAAAFLFSRQGGGTVPGGLHTYLFAAADFDPRMGRALQQRYRNASAHAAQFCGRLERRYLRQNRSGSLVRELRRFYRLGQRAKLHYARRTGAASAVM